VGAVEAETTCDHHRRATARNDAFALYLVDWFVRRVYQELDGTLDDSIPRIPG
jgi:hypothetical protein